MVKWMMGGALVLALVAAPVWAGQPTQQQPIRAIPKSYVSPGASGSVGTSEHYERHDLYGGQRLPDTPTRQSNQYGNQSIETRGGIRQTIEYPGGHVIERSPGSGSYQRERIR